MRNKKDIPLAILQALESFVNLKGSKFEAVDPNNNLLSVIDKDENSSFHFTIIEYKDTSNSFLLLMDRSPKNKNDTNTYQSWIEISKLQYQFTTWIELLDQYDNVKSFFDDPILTSFSDEFYAEFEIIEEDAETKPFNTKQILLLDKYLNTIENKINKFATEENSSELNIIKQDINVLKDNLTNKPKTWVIRKLSNIWARMAKQGIQFIKEFLTESKKEVIKQGIKGLIEYVIENGPNLIH